MYVLSSHLTVQGQLNNEIENKSSEAKLLEAQIVRSPEKIKRQLSEMEAHLDREKKFVVDADKQIAKAEKQATTMAKILNDLNSCM